MTIIDTENSLGYQIKVVQHGIRNMMDRLLREINLTTPQYAALTILDTSPGISGAALARKCFVTPQTMNEILTNLSELNYVVRQQHPQHGRIIQTYLTTTGKQKLVEAELAIESVDDLLSKPLTLEEKKRIIEWLKACHTLLMRD